MIYLYAEVLANIRQANLYASLETRKNEHTKIDVASDKKTITVSHNGETASIYLPTEISGNAEINIPIDRGKEVSVRLELADIMTMPSLEDAIGGEGPWSARDLSPNTRLRCRACQSGVLVSEMPMAFKDLPSDHWAEMMDFWHCHRPHHAEPNQAKDTEEAAQAKGYGNSSKLKATRGVAFVDTASFLLAEQSCRNMEVRIIILLRQSHPTLACHNSLCFDTCMHQRVLPFWVKRRRPFAHRKRYHVQAADTLALNQTSG